MITLVQYTHTSSPLIKGFDDFLIMMNSVVYSQLYIINSCHNLHYIITSLQISCCCRLQYTWQLVVASWSVYGYYWRMVVDMTTRIMRRRHHWIMLNERGTLFVRAYSQNTQVSNSRPFFITITKSS